MLEWIIPVVTSITSVATLAITSVGLSEAARLRKNISDLAPALAHLPRKSTAHGAIVRSIDLSSAKLAAIRLVPISGAFVVLIIAVFIAGLTLMVIIRNPAGGPVGGVVVLVSYVLVFLYVPNVTRLRNRQVRAILAGRPSGMVRLDAVQLTQRTSVRNRIDRPSEYPLVALLMMPKREKSRDRRASRARASGAGTAPTTI